MQINFDHNVELENLDKLLFEDKMKKNQSIKINSNNSGGNKSISSFTKWQFSKISSSVNGKLREPQNFHQNDESAFDFSVFDHNGNTLLQQAYSQNKKDFESVFYSNEIIYSVTIQNKKTNSFQWQSLIYGMYLSNGKSGVIYNSLGVNGAEYLAVLLILTMAILPSKVPPFAGPSRPIRSGSVPLV